MALAAKTIKAFKANNPAPLTQAQIDAAQDQINIEITDAIYHDLTAKLTPLAGGTGEGLLQFSYHGEAHHIADGIEKDDGTIIIDPREKFDRGGRLMFYGADLIDAALERAISKKPEGLEQITFVVLGGCNTEMHAGLIRTSLKLNTFIRGVFSTTDDIGLEQGSIPRPTVDTRKNGSIIYPGPGN